MTFLNNLEYKKYIIFLIFLIGCIISFIQSSNFSDADAYSLINVFLDIINYGVYNPSRGAYGHPIPEIVIGFIVYNFGSPYSNIICFLLFFSSILILFITFFKKENNILLFLVLIISNPFLFFENLTSSDYQFAIFFFSLGLFFLFKKNYLLSSLVFALCIASRANFTIFIYPLILIFFLKHNQKFDIFNYFKLNIILTIIGLLFYFPVFYSNNFNIDFIQIPFLTKSSLPGWYGGPAFEFNVLAPRFIYKIYNLLGIFSIFIIVYSSFDILRKIFQRLNAPILIFLFIIFSNLLFFFFAPTKISLLCPFILAIYLIIFSFLDKKKIYLIITFNFLSWIISYDLLDIKYKTNNICLAKEAVSANFNFILSDGYIKKYFDSNKNINKCYANSMIGYEDKFIKGLPLKK